MHQGQLVFAQLMRHLPLTTFRRCVARYAGEHKVKSFSCHDQYLCMAFAQLTYRESLRDIEASLRAQSAKLYHLGIRGNVARNTLAKRQCDARLAYLRELRRAVDWYRAACMPRNPSVWIWPRRFTHSMRRPSICACRYFRGRAARRSWHSAGHLSS